MPSGYTLKNWGVRSTIGTLYFDQLGDAIEAVARLRCLNYISDANPIFSNPSPEVLKLVNK